MTKELKIDQLKKSMSDITEELEERINKAAGGEMGFILIPFEILDPIAKDDRREIMPVVSMLASNLETSICVDIMMNMVAEFKAGQITEGLKELFEGIKNDKCH
jgi:hypothetical protein